MIGSIIRRALVSYQLGPRCVTVQGRGDALTPALSQGGVFRLSSNHAVTVAATGIQCSVCYLHPLQSSSPQLESSAPFVTYTHSRHPRRSWNLALRLLPTPAPVILAAAGIQSPCCHPHGRRMEVPPRLPPHHCCPNRVGSLSRLWIPAAARMTGDRGFS